MGHFRHIIMDLPDSNQPRKENVHLRDNIVQAQQTRLNCPLPRYRHQLLDKARTLLSGIADLLGEASQPMVLFQPSQNQFAAKHHTGEQVIEVMGNPTNESTDCLHLVRFPNLLLGGRAVRRFLGLQMQLC
jgi:hypothetical protein